MRRRKRRPTPKHSLRVTRMKARLTATISRSASASILRELLTSDGRVAINRTTEELRMSKANLASTIGVAAETLQRAARADAPKTQARLREAIEIMARVSPWTGGLQQAMAWYRAEPIPAFGGRTAESLVKEGKAAAVRDYLDGVALGGFA
jgi:Protein of unknown function (DUF2384)